MKDKQASCWYLMHLEHATIVPALLTLLLIVLDLLLMFWSRETQVKAEVWTHSQKVWLDFPVRFFTEKTPQLFKDNSTTTSPPPILLFHHIRAAEELSRRCIQSPGFPIASASLSIQECLSRVSNSSSNSLALFTLALARMLLSSAALYPLTEGSNHQLWMGQSLQGWRN